MESNYVPFRLYKYILKFLESRSLDLTYGAYDAGKNTKKEALTEEEVINVVQISNRIIIRADDSKSKDRQFGPKLRHCAKFPTRTVLAILHPNHLAHNKSDRLASLVNSMIEKDDTANYDLIIITMDEMAKQVLRKIDTLMSVGDDKQGYRRIDVVPHSYFLFEVTKNKVSGICRIINRDENEGIMAGLNTTERELPRILRVDPIAFWLGAEVGDIVEQINYNENGVEKAYLYCY